MAYQYRRMQEPDIVRVIPMFLEYWNGTGDAWTSEQVYRRIWQVLGSPDSYCMIAEDDRGVLGFAMGRFETFFDLTVYHLVEILVDAQYHGTGIGTAMMTELEGRVRNMGASMLQLSTVPDEMHQHFYGKLGYGDVTTMVMKTRTLV